jgi:acid phosphatase
MSFFRFLPVALASLFLVAQDSRDLGSVWKGQELRSVIIGDFGYRGRDSGQKDVAASIAALHKQRPFHIGITLGDNFYNRGVRGVDDPAWRGIWENDYGALGIPFYAALGNHDYYGNEQAQVDYTRKSKTWRMPYRYYTYLAGPVRLFALDTDEGTTGFWNFGKRWSAAQANWLDSSLKRLNDAPWRIVYGHHPVYSDGEHGDTARMVKQLLPILKAHRVDVYLAGHDHDLQYLEQDGIHFVIAGGGGKNVRGVASRRARFAKATNGFLELTATPGKLTLRLRDRNGADLYSRTLEK